MDPSTYAMLQNMRAERASSEKVVVKSEPGCCDTPPDLATSLSGTKRKLGQEEAREHGACAPRRVFSGDQGKLPDCHDDDTTGREVALQLLQGIVTPSRDARSPRRSPPTSSTQPTSQSSRFEIFRMPVHGHQ